MKKVIVGILCLISTFISLGFFLVEKANDELNLNNIEKLDFTLQKFYVQDSTVSSDEEIIFFKKLSDKYDVSFIRTDRVYQENKLVLYKSGIFSDTYFKQLKEKLPIKSGEAIISKKKFLATFEINDRNQTGQINNFLSETPLVFMSLENLYNNYGMTPGGEYSLVGENNNTDSLLAELATFYSLNTDVLSTPISGFGIDIGGGVYLLAFFSLILIVIYILIVIFYPLSKTRDISTMKLMGYSNLTIWTELFAKVLYFPCIFAVFSLFFQKVTINDLRTDYLFKLTMIQFFFIITCCVISQLMLLSINKLPISLFLKGYMNLKAAISLNYLMKFLVYVSLIFIIPIAVSSLKTLLNTVEIKQVYENQSNLVTLSSITYNEYDIGDSSLEEKLRQLFYELEDTVDAQYIVSERIYPWQIDSEFQYSSSEYLDIVQVNKNYLDHLKFPIKYEDSFSRNRLTIYVPYSKDQNRTETFVLFLVADYLHEMNLEEEQLNDIVEFKYYPENKFRFFSENIDMMEIDQGFISNPVIICLSDSFFTLSNSRLQNSAIYNPLRIENTNENKMKIDAAVHANKLDKNRLKFETVLNSGFAQILQMNLSDATIWLSAILFSTLVSILASYYIVLTVLISKLKEVSVLKFLGYSFYQIYKNELFYFGLIYLFGFIELLIINKDVSSLMVYVLFTTLDFGLTYYLVKKYEKKSVTHLLKGAP